MTATTKKRPGRPLEFGRPVSLRLSPLDHSTLRQLAESRGCSFSDAMRHLIHEYRATAR